MLRLLGAGLLRRGRGPAPRPLPRTPGIPRRCWRRGWPACRRHRSRSAATAHTQRNGGRRGRRRRLSGASHAPPWLFFAKLIPDTPARLLGTVAQPSGATVANHLEFPIISGYFLETRFARMINIRRQATSIFIFTARRISNRIPHFARSA